MRRILVLAAGAVLACSGHSELVYAEQGSAAECGWRIVALVTTDAPCWRIESLDVATARLRADGREHDCWGEVGACDLFACETVGGLERGSVVQVLAPASVTPDVALAATVTSVCE